MKKMKSDGKEEGTIPTIIRKKKLGTDKAGEPIVESQSIDLPVQLRSAEGYLTQNSLHFMLA